MKVITWMRYKLLSDNRMNWSFFRSFGITDKSNKFTYLRYFLKFIGMLVSVVIGVGLASILKYVFHLNSDISWIIYFTWYYFGAAWWEGTVTSPIQSKEIPLLKSLLKVQGVGLKLLSELYYAQATLRSSFISDCIIVFSFAAIYHQPIWELIIFIILGEVIRFSIIALSRTASETFAIYNNSNSAFARNLILATAAASFGLLLVVLRLNFLGNADVAAGLAHPDETLNVLLTKMQSIDFTNLNYYGWYPGTMLIQASFHLAVVSLLLFIGVTIVINIATYALASLNENRQSSAFSADLAPILMDSTVLKLFGQRGGFVFAQLKEAFLNPVYKRAKLLLQSLVFIMTSVVVVFTTNNETVRFSLFFILSMWISIADKNVFRFNGPFGFYRRESVLFSNVTVSRLLISKVSTALVFQYVTIIYVFVASFAFFSDYLLRLGAIFWGLLLIVGKSAIHTLASSYNLNFQGTLASPNQEMKSATGKFIQILVSPLVFAGLVLLYKPALFQNYTWFYPFMLYTLLSYILAVGALRIGLIHRVRNHLRLLIGSMSVLGLVFGIPVVLVFNQSTSQDAFVLAGLFWLRLIWLCGSFIHHNQVPRESIWG